ncbi:hypothetical protein [Tsukamurella ocularis]|uniref:hypothetical protein n=1 Tax=Tsukamurella ocularis TaxID=1970234 RepID=UPI00216770EF|nr:hypothetical protein [Tsukamurella ocularis]MCS3782398.1 hypothetical protein [Tsukamurella ocularis]MCS3789803.1 hypothetical protein [Tsukamurella ocularis]MCS3853188.1 hypothetical protein [Tsukamurella ocularis]
MWRADLQDDAPVPSWWLDAIGPDGGHVIAAHWRNLFGRDLFPRFADLLRSDRCVGAALMREDYLYDSEWFLVVAFDYIPNPDLDESEREPVLYDLRPPVSKSAPLPPWWDHYPPDLADFYLRAHASIGCFGEILSDPSDCRAESAIFASLPAPTHQDWQYFGDAPDPHELLEIARLNQFELLFLDVGRPTHDGWVRSWLGEDGGVDRVDILEAVDHFLIDDYDYQSTRTSGRLGPARPRDHTLDRPNASCWVAYSREIGGHPGWPNYWTPSDEEP